MLNGKPVPNGRPSSILVLGALILVSIAAGGCQTGKGTGTLAGAGVGALIGQAVGGNTQATLIGGAIGAGVGYVIGDQVDQKKAEEMSKSGDTHNEVAPLGGTRWKLVSVNARQPVKPYLTKIVEFQPNGHVITTTTQQDHSQVVNQESYRVVGDTLIVNKPGYLVNARFRIDQQQLIIDDPGFSAVLEKT